MPNDEPTRRFRHRFSLRQLFLAVALIGVGLAIWIWVFRKEVVVRAAGPEDDLHASHFGFSKGWTARNIAVAQGRFQKGMGIEISFNFVRLGVVQTITSYVGRDEGWPIWEPRDYFIAVSEYEATGRRLAKWLIVGTNSDRSLDRSWSEDFEDDINVIATKTLPGQITPGRPHVVYVEGDQAIVVDGNMTVEQFAKTNPGNYLVVTVEVR